MVLLLLSVNLKTVLPPLCASDISPSNFIIENERELSRKIEHK